MSGRETWGFSWEEIEAKALRYLAEDDAWQAYCDQPLPDLPSTEYEQLEDPYLGETTIGYERTEDG
jgi:hypothetical protein